MKESGIGSALGGAACKGAKKRLLVRRFDCENRGETIQACEPPTDWTWY